MMSDLSMFQSTILLIISILFVVSFLSIISDKIRIPYPIFLVISGLIISLVPDVPRVYLEPDLVFIIFLPPLLFAAALSTSWKEFWFYRRPIGLMAFGLVIFTSGIIAFLSHAFIPDFPLALGFLLGGIISPPDAVAATSVLREHKIPRRSLVVLEGESLINDASSIIVFRFALAAMLTGQFVFVKAGLDFLLVSFAGIFIGTGVAIVVRLIHKLLVVKASIATAISLISPYLMYVVADRFHFSGVLAVVSGGLYLSYHGSTIYTYDSRMQMQSVWDTLVFLLNGVVFILIGLQLPEIIEGLENYSLTDAIFYGVIISLATILIRIVWVYPATYLPRWFSKKVREREANPGWKSVFIVAWSGMRGVVSLGVALTIPLTLSDGQAFPYRNLILFITFCVILTTLVFQGLSLPYLIKLLNIKVSNIEAHQRQVLHHELSLAALNYLKATYPDEIKTNPVFEAARNRYEKIVEMAEKRLQQDSTSQDTVSSKYYHMLLELVLAQREKLSELKDKDVFIDELLRNKEIELDLEESRLRRLLT